MTSQVYIPLRESAVKSQISGAMRPIESWSSPTRPRPLPSADLEKSLRDLAYDFGLQGGHYVHVGHAVRHPGAGRASQPSRFVATSLFHRRLYMDGDGRARNDADRRAIDAATPFAWTATVEDEADSVLSLVAGRSRGRHVRDGLTIPVQDYAAGPAYICLHSAFDGEAEHLVAMRGAELAYAAACFHHRAKTTPCSSRSDGGDRILTPREMDCLRLAALGHTVTETAEALHVTPRTVEFHLKNAADKFDAPNKLRAVVLAISRGLISV